MKISKLWLFMIAIVAIGLIGLYVTPSDAAHPDVTLKDGSGISVAATTNPYSPKKSCSGCHFYNLDGSRNFATTQSTTDFSDYEAAVGTVTKDQYTNGVLGASYTVPYPQHGASASYHVQQGRNLPWSSIQRTYYGLNNFTSSPGMYGKY